MQKGHGIKLLAILFTLAACSKSQSPYNPDNTPREIEGYELVWHEEFNKGTKPDTSIWSYENGFVRNQELQWYQRDNATIENGLLVIEGRREKVKNPYYDSTAGDWRRSRPFAEYTSTSINTRGNQSFQNGIFEIRARIDTARGLWPAIWCLGTHPDRGWPANGEIDILEFYRVDGKPTILANAAWAGTDQQYDPVWDDKRVPFQHFLDQDPDWPQKFHIWKMEWTEDSIQLFLDDEMINEIDLKKTLNTDGFNPFHQPHYILLNLAIGSNGGNPSGTQFPKHYEVDYVRVYQKL